MSQLRYKSIFEALTDDPAEAADLKFRSDVILVLRDLFESKSLSQAQIAQVLNVSQPRVSELMRGKIDKFSADKLIGFLSLAGIRLRPAFVPATRSKPAKVQCEVLCAA